MPTEGPDSLTGKTPSETYQNLLQINDDNELLNGIGGEVSPVIGGNLNVTGQIFKNGVEVGTSNDNFWSQNTDGEIYRSSNVGVGVGSNPEAKLEVNSDSTTEDFFIVKKTTESGGVTSTKDVFKINNEGTMVLGGNSTAPTVTEGAIYYDSTEKEFYLGKG
tara:strand:- start:4150 stop:4635 length:486 start_codon:yes stop_codon:yes gene_type:complete